MSSESSEESEPDFNSVLTYGNMGICLFVVLEETGTIAVPEASITGMSILAIVSLLFIMVYAHREGEEVGGVNYAAVVLYGIIVFSAVPDVGTRMPDSLKPIVAFGFLALEATSPILSSTYTRLRQSLTS